MKTTALCILAAILSGCCTQQACVERRGPLTRDLQEVELNDYGIYHTYVENVPESFKAPRGYRPCYLSHYGRHGSRYLLTDPQYDYAHEVLSRAHADGMLTALGESVYERYNEVWPELHGHGGELTHLGQMQHRGIAGRMVANYPSLFKKGSRIVARSTNLERTMLSMNAFTNRLCELRPGLQMDIDATHLEMNYLNPHSKDNPKGTAADHQWRSSDGVWRPEFNAYRDSVIARHHFAERLFKDNDYALSICNPVSLETDLYTISVSLEGCPVGQEGYFDLFDKSELEDLVQIEASILYAEKGRYQDPRSRGWLLSESLLNDFIARTEEDLSGGISARLRFGHDGCIMGLFALMDIPGWNQSVSGIENIWGIWDVSSITMAANIQFVFYRKGDDLIFAPLFNEQPMELPLDEAAPGFYSWRDFKAKYSAVIRQACTELERTDI